MSRIDILQHLLDQGLFFKLVCGAGNEDVETVRKLSMLYTLAGAKGMDVSANPEVVKGCMEGIDLAFSKSKKMGINLSIRPFITVSVGMPGDHHVRKAYINNDKCIKCKLCISKCPTQAIDDKLIINSNKCIGCGNCSSICLIDGAIKYRHNEKALKVILPECMSSGAENIELHAAVENNESIMTEWKLINEINDKNHNSMCLDRLHLSDFALENRILEAKKITGDRLIIQADGYPMSGGEDDYNTTLQAVAITDVINKRFNMYNDLKTKKKIYKEQQDVNILISGGTNSLTTELASKSGVRFQGVSLGTFARKIVNDIILNDCFYQNDECIKQGYMIARNLVLKNIGDYNE